MGGAPRCPPWEVPNHFFFFFFRGNKTAAQGLWPPAFGGSPGVGAQVRQVLWAGLGGGGLPAPVLPLGVLLGSNTNPDTKGPTGTQSGSIFLYFVAISGTVGVWWGLFQNLLRSVPGRQREREGRPGRSMAVGAVPTALHVAQNQDLGLVAAGGGPSAWSRPRPRPGTEAPPRGTEGRFLGEGMDQGLRWLVLCAWLLAPRCREWPTGGAHTCPAHLGPKPEHWGGLDPCREMMGEGKPAPPPPLQPTPTPPLHS